MGPLHFRRYSAVVRTRQLALISHKSSSDHSPYRMPPKLPAELSDAIIDHLHNDKASLAACALVCKGWVPASRHHLFRSVVIDPLHVAAFISLVQSPLSTIPGHITHFGMQDIRNLDKILILCMNYLHSVTSLCLTNFHRRLLESAAVVLTIYRYRTCFICRFLIHPLCLLFTN